MSRCSVAREDLAVSDSPFRDTTSAGIVVGHAETLSPRCPAERAFGIHQEKTQDISCCVGHVSRSVAEGINRMRWRNVVR